MTADHDVAGAIALDLLREVEQFLFYEAELLDRWELREWLTLFTERSTWVVPSCDLPGGTPDNDLMLVHDDLFLLSHRVESLLGKTVYAESPRSRTRRLVSNIRLLPADAGDGTVRVRANFVVYRMTRTTQHAYVGSYEHTLERAGGAGGLGGGLRFLERRTVLDLGTLRPHGKLGFIL